MKIQKGHYVPKELITSEAVCEAVVKCFAAAGFHRNRDYVDYRAKEHWGCIAISCSGVICWSDKQEHSLTLQQLFTAENGLQWPDWADSICTNGESVYFCNDVKFSFIVGSSFGGDVELLATRQSKEKEVKEKSPLGKYEWGKEYPTNGKRPDLPDDVLVEFKNKHGYWHPDGCCKVVEWIWNDYSQGFRITDPRYKPVDEVSEISESKPDDEAVSEKPESNWFERGEFPAIGSKVTIAKGSDDLSDFGSQFIGQECTVRAIFKNQYGRDIVSVERPDGACCCFVLDIVEPAKSESEKVIEAANKIYYASVDVDDFIENLVKAEMLVLPPNKSDTED